MNASVEVSGRSCASRVGRRLLPNLESGWGAVMMT